MNVLIVAAGKKPPVALLTERAGQADFVIAVDGGARVLKKAGCIPNLLVGDMDSVDSGIVGFFTGAGSDCIKLEREKDDTDTFAALEEAVKRGAKNVVILGATGKRTDHMLSNIMLLKWSLKKGVKAVLEDELETIEIGAGSFEVSGSPGQTVSIIPVNATARVTASGFYYPLDNLLLKNSRPRGVSNILVGDRAEVYSKSPVLIIKIK